MVKKPNQRTAASSAAAAAAAASTLPTFTSFAAATAHALGNHEQGGTGEVSVEYGTSEWDSNALQLVRKISRRDSTTKLRAITELTEHLEKVDSSQRNIGKVFISAWGPAFRSIITEETNPSIRTAVIMLMPLIISKFGRLVQPVFLSLLQTWIGAQGDKVMTVSNSAKKSIEESLPTPARKEKVLSRYAVDLCGYCVNESSRILEGNSTYSQAAVRRIFAIINWLVETANSTTHISPFLDDERDFLMTLTKGKKKRKTDDNESCIREACQLSVNISKALQHGNNEDEVRAKKLADVALYGIKQGETIAWDLVIILLQQSWHSLFGMELDSLQKPLHRALREGKSSALHALLPILDTLPPTSSSITFAKKVLDVLKDSLYSEKDVSSNVTRSSISTNFIITTLPAYIESIAYVLIKGSTKWSNNSDGNDDMNLYDVFFSSYFESLFVQYLSCKVPPVLKIQSSNTRAKSDERRTFGQANYTGAIDSVTHSFVCILRHLRYEKLSPFLKKTFDEIKFCGVENVSERINRLERIVTELKNDNANRIIILLLLKQIENHGTEDDCVIGARFASSVLAEKSLISPEIGVDSINKFIDDLAFLILLLLQKSMKSGSQDIFDKIRPGISGIISYVAWAATSSDQKDISARVFQKLSEILSQTQIWALLGDVIIAHSKRRENESFSEWRPLIAEGMEANIKTACDQLANGNICSNSLHLLTAYMEPKHHTHKTPEVVNSINQLLLTKIRDSTDTQELDPLILTWLNSVSKGTASESNHDLLLVSFNRAVYNNDIMSSLLSIFQEESIERVMQFGHGVVGDIGRRYHSIRENEALEKYAVASAQIVKLIGEKLVDKSVLISKELLSYTDSQFSKSFLSEVPLDCIFGNGTTTVVDTEFFFDWCGNSDAELGEKISSLRASYLNSLEETNKKEIISMATKRILQTGWAGNLDILRTILVNKEDQNLVQELIVTMRDSTMELVTEKSDTLSNTLRNLPRILSFSMHVNKKTTQESFEPLFGVLMKIIRLELPFQNALLCLDAISASLVTRPSDSTCSWLQDSVSLSLRAIRGIFQQPRGISNKDLQALESHGALLMWRTILSFTPSNISPDDIRFWSLRTIDALQSFTKKKLTQVSTEAICRRICNFSRLALAMVEHPDLETHLSEKVTDDLCHWGAWSAINLFPLIAIVRSESTDSGDDVVASVNGKDCGQLVLLAAGRDALLDQDGNIPVPSDRVYELTTFLSSNCNLSRRGAFTLLSYVMAITLPEAIAHNFPTDGFSDEAKELSFVTRTIPESLQKALMWNVSEQDEDEEPPESVLTNELGFFLSWRLFLDLLRLAPLPVEAATSAKDTASSREDLSMMRIGSTYLHANPQLFAGLLNRCIDVVVDGSAKEIAAAGMAAAEALQSEQRPPQGIQLAMEENKEKTQSEDKNNNEEIKDLETEVGHAGGIALARALQRLPALSREHVTGGLDANSAQRLEAFVRKKVSPLLIAAEINNVKEWGSFGGGALIGATGSSGTDSIVDSEGEVRARGSLAGREVWATYTFHDVTLEIGLKMPDVFPLRTAVVEARSGTGMSEAKWRKTVLGMTALLRGKDGSLADAVELWRRNLDRTFEGAEECPICYSVLDLTTAAMPNKPCRTCSNLFHSTCLLKWFRKSNSSACPMCRTAF